MFTREDHWNEKELRKQFDAAVAERNYRTIAQTLSVLYVMGSSWFDHYSNDYRVQWVAPNPNKEKYPDTWVGIVFDKRVGKLYFHGGIHSGLTTTQEIEILVNHKISQRRKVLMPQFAAALKSVAEDASAPKWQRKQAAKAHLLFERALKKLA